MATGLKTPILVGVGDVTNRSTKAEDAVEPLKLMIQAIQKAIQDTRLASELQSQLRQRIDSMSVVATWTWPYTDLPSLIASNLDVQLKHEVTSEHGGNSPGLLLHRAASKIEDGSCEVAIVTGGEALASLAALHKAKVRDPISWTPRPSGEKSLMESMLEQGTLPESIGTKHAVGMPVHVYPMYENGLRAHRGQSLRDNLSESAEMYAHFAQVAAKNPAAWTYEQTPASAETLQNATGKNRMICTPYPLLMNAFNSVNQAAACVLTSTDVAIELGISEELWIYPVGAAGFNDSDEFWLRPNYHSCPSIENSIDTALELASLRKEQIDILDIYSCFPIVPKLVCQHFGLSCTKPSKTITLLGGLISFGGAGNNYSMHALVEMTRELRRGQKHHGLVLANGGMLTHQHTVVLSNQAPRVFGLPLNQAHHPCQSENVVPFDNHAEGEAIIETYTVEFGRDGRPARGHIVGRLQSNQHRFIANEADYFTLIELVNADKEPIGRNGFVSASSDGRNLFTLKVNSHM